MVGNYCITLSTLKHFGATVASESNKHGPRIVEVANQV